MASMASPRSSYLPSSRSYLCNRIIHNKRSIGSSLPLIIYSHHQNNNNNNKPTDQMGRSGTKPDYLGVQKNNPSLALCPATKNCISTSENGSDLTHYAPPCCRLTQMGTQAVENMALVRALIYRNYNPEGKRGNKSREDAMEELLQVIRSTKADKSKPRIVEKKDDYLHVEYESPILGLVDDVEFWFPPGKKPIVEYRSASRLGNFDFDANRKRIKALRLELEKKGWASENSF
ncbi:hypothetical protein C3L33_05026, partial [Rhododendron williamsianum]